MGIEKFLLARKTFAAGLVSVAALVSGCESALYEIPKKASEKVVDMTYAIATLPQEPLPWLKEEPPLNGCFESIRERVCKLYLRDKDEEYFGVLRVEKRLFYDTQRLVLGYFNGDNYNWDRKKILVVVEFKGNSSEEFIEPHYGKNDYLLSKFLDFFEKPRSNRLDLSDNHIEKAKAGNLISDFKRVKFFKMLEERVGRALEIMEHNNLYKIKSIPKGN
jgi:hypothetical protein